MTEGAGQAGYRPTPMGRVPQKARRTTTASAKYPAFPARWPYGLYVLSPGTGLIAPVARNARHEHRRLGISTGMPGPHDFAVRIELFVGATRSRCNSIHPPHPALHVR